MLKQSFNDWNDDNAQRLGASLAFYTVLSISPLVIFTVALVSVFLNHSDAQAHLLEEVRSLVGPDGKQAVESLLASGQKVSSGIIATLLGLATLLFGASSVFNELRSALNTIWEVDPANISGFKAMLRERFFSIGMVFSVGFLLLVSLLVSTALSATSGYLTAHLHFPAAMLLVFNFVIAFGGISLLFALIFKYLPETHIPWRDVRLGAVVTALLFSLGKLALGLYLGKASPGSTYGAAGSLVVLVVWVYYAAQIFFFGAEFTHVYAEWLNTGKVPGSVKEPAAAAKG